ncbi:MAG: EamA family transporter [Bdellovibrionota bacterium]
MSWFVVSLLCAVAEAAKDTACKLSIRESDSLTISLASLLVPLPYFLVRAVAEPLPHLDHFFFLALFCHCTLFSASLALYNQALKMSPLSLTVPLVCFTPAFFIVTSPLILGETISPWGIAGCALIVLGGYSLYVEDGSFELLGPLRAIARERGAWYMLIVAFVWSITGNFDRMGVLHSNTHVWPAASLTAISLVLAGARRVSGSKRPIATRKNIVAGTLNGFSIYFYIWGISLQKVAYVVTVKRLSVLLGVVLGAVLFREANFRQRLFGASLMVIGVMCVAFAK